jgi:anthranilate phosphoribosyltransferase
MDELSTLGQTHVAELTEDGMIREYAIAPKDLGVARADEPSILHQGDRFEEAIRLLRVLSGIDRGQRREIVCLNAAPLLCITNRALDLREGMHRAADVIDSGKPIKKLEAWVAEQNSYPGERLEKLEEMLALACS